MEIKSFNAQKRKGVGKSAVRHLRQNGEVPGVVYGEGEDPLNLKVNEHDLRGFLGTSGESTLVELIVENDEPILALVEEIQHHPVTDRILHVDFKLIPRDKPVEISVPIELIGVSPGVKEGGLLEQTMRELNIKCKPTDAPENVVIDISELDFDNAIHVNEIEIPEDVEILDDMERTVVTVIVPKMLEVEEEAPVAEEMVTEEGVVEGVGGEAGGEEKEKGETSAQE